MCRSDQRDGGKCLFGNITSSTKVAAELMRSRIQRSWCYSVILHPQGWQTTTNMYIFELMFRLFVNLAKQAWQLPHSVAIALLQKRNQNPQPISERERLDRIRHPAKYAGR